MCAQFNTCVCIHAAGWREMAKAWESLASSSGLIVADDANVYIVSVGINCKLVNRYKPTELSSQRGTGRRAGSKNHIHLAPRSHRRTKYSHRVPRGVRVAGTWGRSMTTKALRTSQHRPTDRTHSAFQDTFSTCGIRLEIQASYLLLFHCHIRAEPARWPLSYGSFFPLAVVLRQN